MKAKTKRRSVSAQALTSPLYRQRKLPNKKRAVREADDTRERMKEKSA